MRDLMSTATALTRIDRDLYESARAFPGSATERINRWARIGRAFETKANVSPGDIERVLAGTYPYDALGKPEQAIVQSRWREGIADDISKLDFAAEFRTRGESWSESDAADNTIICN
ncbi:MAG: ParD-like family protein [Promicromonosporaceae bacterium]|nr:ParD-like family protein [Promicromonosporaceae bacterium]